MRRLAECRRRLFAVAAGLAVVLGLLVSATDAMASPTVATSADAPDDTYYDAPAGSYDIIATLHCQCYNGQGTIAYRRGYYIAPSTGFGHKKVLYKHNMWTPVVAFIVNGPHNSGTSGTSGEAYAYAYHFLNGVLLQQIKIWAKYDTRLLSDDRSFGIVTGWCAGYDGACPQWVNEAINAAPLISSAPSSDQPDGTQLGYDPRAG
jgi:hypothetical protein